MSTKRLLLAVAAAICLTATGCGSSNTNSDSGPTDEEAITASVDSYYDGFGAGDGEAACAQLTDKAKEEIAGGLGGGIPSIDDATCASTIESVAELAAESDVGPPRGEVTSVEVDGDSATAHLAGQGTKVEMVKEDGTWLMDSGFIEE